MAIVLVDGFDLYNGTGANTGMGAKWAIATTSSRPVEMVPGRFGGQGFQTGATTGALGIASAFRTLPAPLQALSYGFVYRANSFFNPSWFHWLRSPTGVYTAALVLNVDGSISAVRATGQFAGVTLGTSPPNVIIQDVFHYLEVEFVRHDTTGVFNVYADGQLVLALSNVDTNNAVPSVAQIGFGHGTGVTGTNAGQRYTFDDLYVTDTPTRLGERRVEPLYVVRDVLTQWAPSGGAANYALVDEPQANATDYVSASEVGTRDLYGVGALSSTPTMIDAVQVTSFALKTDATTREINNTLRSNGVDSDGPAFPLAGGYQKLDRILERNPDGNALWTPAAVNSLLIGPKVAA